MFIHNDLVDDEICQAGARSVRCLEKVGAGALASLLALPPEMARRSQGASQIEMRPRILVGRADQSNTDQQMSFRSR